MKIAITFECDGDESLGCCLFGDVARQGVDRQSLLCQLVDTLDKWGRIQVVGNHLCALIRQLFDNGPANPPRRACDDSDASF